MNEWVSQFRGFCLGWHRWGMVRPDSLRVLSLAEPMPDTIGHNALIVKDSSRTATLFKYLFGGNHRGWSHSIVSLINFGDSW